MVWVGAGGTLNVWAPGDKAPTNVNTVPLASGLHPQIAGDRVVWQSDHVLEPFDIACLVAGVTQTAENRGAAHRWRGRVRIEHTRDALHAPLQF